MVGYDNEEEQNPELGEEDVGLATLVTGRIEGEPFWAYVSIYPEKYQDFLSAHQRGDAYRLPDYGDILEYKVGEESPPDSIREKIERIYGLDHNFEEMMREMADTLSGRVDKWRDDDDKA